MRSFPVVALVRYCKDPTVTGAAEEWGGVRLTGSDYEMQKVEYECKTYLHKTELYLIPHDSKPYEKKGDDIYLYDVTKLQQVFTPLKEKYTLGFIKNRELVGYEVLDMDAVNISKSYFQNPFLTWKRSISYQGRVAEFAYLKYVLFYAEKKVRIKYIPILQRYVDKFESILWDLLSQGSAIEDVIDAYLNATNIFTLKATSERKAVEYRRSHFNIVVPPHLRFITSLQASLSTPDEIEIENPIFKTLAVESISFANLIEQDLELKPETLRVTCEEKAMQSYLEKIFEKPKLSEVFLWDQFTLPKTQEYACYIYLFFIAPHAWQQTLNAKGFVADEALEFISNCESWVNEKKEVTMLQMIAAIQKSVPEEKDVFSQVEIYHYYLGTRSFPCYSYETERLKKLLPKSDSKIESGVTYEEEISTILCASTHLAIYKTDVGLFGMYYYDALKDKKIYLSHKGEEDPKGEILTLCYYPHDYFTLH